MTDQDGANATIMVQRFVAAPESRFNERLVNFGAPGSISGPIRLNLH